MAFKPDSSFFEKIALGAVGAQAVVQYLESFGHQVAELENGSTATKMWKEVKRKRVRIPDLVCVRCGRRIESRAKSKKPELAMSHSGADAERAWDYGMVDEDWIAFPVCYRQASSKWAAGRLDQRVSYWHSRERIRWIAKPHIGVFRVADFRATPSGRSTTKGVTEGAETAISWDAVFSNRAGSVTRIDGSKVTVRREVDGHSYTWQNAKNLPLAVRVEDTVAEHQVLAATVLPRFEAELRCPGTLPPDHISELLRSPERTQRFTGVKLARLRREFDQQGAIVALGEHRDEDIYVQLESAAYLVTMGIQAAEAAFRPYLDHREDQVRLEAVVALAETRTAGAARLLAGILDDQRRPYFLKSAAAWGLGIIGGPESTARLVQAFADVDAGIREEALEAITMLGTDPLPHLLGQVFSPNERVAAGAAEAIRRVETVPDDTVKDLVQRIGSGEPAGWAAWLLGSLPHPDGIVQLEVATLQEERPEVHFAVTVLASFMESWIARSWEAFPRPQHLASDFDRVDE